jgi:hypothetical protein
MIKKIVFTVCALLVSASMYAQEIQASALKSEWTEVYQKDGLTFYVRSEAVQLIPNAKPYEYAFVKVVNTTNEPLKLTCNVAMHFDTGCDGCEMGERTAHITVPANGSVESSSTQFIAGLHGLIRNHNLANTPTLQFVSIPFISITH